MRLKDIGISLRDEKKVLRNGMILLVFAAVLVLVLMRFDQVWGAVLTVVGTVAPVFYGIVLAYILNVFVHFFEDVAFKPCETSNPSCGRGCAARWRWPWLTCWWPWCWCPSSPSLSPA